MGHEITQLLQEIGRDPKEAVLLAGDFVGHLLCPERGIHEITRNSTKKSHQYGERSCGFLEMKSVPGAIATGSASGRANWRSSVPSRYRSLSQPSSESPGQFGVKKSCGWVLACGRIDRRLNTTAAHAGAVQGQGGCGIEVDVGAQIEQCPQTAMATG